MEKLLEDMDYEQIVQSLRNLPMTWYPALIVEMIEAAHNKKVFKDGGATSLARSVEKKLGKPEGKRCGININYKEDGENITVLLGPPGVPACDAVQIVQHFLGPHLEKQDEPRDDWQLVWEEMKPIFENLGFDYVDDWDAAEV